MKKREILLLATFAVLFTFSLIFQNLFFDVLLLINFGALVFSLCYRTNIIFKYSFEFFYAVFMLAGVFLCNTDGLFLSELGTWTHYNNSFPIALLYYTVFFLVLIFSDKVASKRLDKSLTHHQDKPNIFTKIPVRSIIFILGLIMFISVAGNPSFASNMDRFVYKETYLPKFYGFLETAIVCSTPLLILVGGFKKKDRKQILLTVGSILPFLLYAVWTGNKFGLFFNIIILALSIIYGANVRRVHKAQTKKQLKTILLVTLVLLGFLIPYYQLRDKNATDAIYVRTAQQGQLWWATYNDKEANSNNLDQLSDELAPLGAQIQRKEVPETYGIYKIMQATTPTSIYERKIASGSRYSAQGIEIAFYYFGYPGIIMHAALRAFLEVLLVNILIWFYRRKDYIGIIAASWLILAKHSIFTQGDLYKIFGITIIAATAYITIKILLDKKSNKQLNLH